MIILLSPAKTLDEGAVDLGCKASEPLFASYTQELLTSLQSLSKAELQSTLGVSLTLAR